MKQSKNDVYFNKLAFLSLIPSVEKAVHNLVSNLRLINA